MHPAITTRRQPALFLVLAAIWSAHGVPAGPAWHYVARNAHLGWTSTVSSTARAKVLLGRLSLERRHSRARTNLHPALATLPPAAGAVDSRPAWNQPAPFRDRVSTALHGHRQALFGRPPPISFPA